MDKTFIEEVIISTTERRGKGVEGDPIRIITKVYSKDGQLIAEHDPCQQSSHTAPAPVIQEGKERIDVNGFHRFSGGLSNEDGGIINVYQFNTRKDFPKEKFLAIKQAIEQVLNDDAGELAKTNKWWYQRGRKDAAAEKEQPPVKDWEVVVYKSQSGSIWTKNGYGKWESNNDKVDGFVYNDGEISKWTDIQIHSVKRNSDGCVFSVGDEVVKWGKIESFEIANGIWLNAICNDGLPETKTVQIFDLKKCHSQSIQTQDKPLERIEVTLKRVTNCCDPSVKPLELVVHPTRGIAEWQLPLIKQAIEKILNNE